MLWIDERDVGNLIFTIFSKMIFSTMLLMDSFNYFIDYSLL